MKILHKFTKKDIANSEIRKIIKAVIEMKNLPLELLCCDDLEFVDLYYKSHGLSDPVPLTMLSIFLTRQIEFTNTCVKYAQNREVFKFFGFINNGDIVPYLVQLIGIDNAICALLPWKDREEYAEYWKLWRTTKIVWDNNYALTADLPYDIKLELSYWCMEISFANFNKKYKKEG
jgi:hypothetical protein